MGSRLTYYRSGELQITYKNIQVDANSTLSLPLVNKNEFNKIEIEYGFIVSNKPEVGRITILFDGTNAEVTSFEKESSTSLGEQNNVNIDAYVLLDDIGLEIVNTANDSFVFNYYIVNKFKLT